MRRSDAASIGLLRAMTDPFSLLLLLRDTRDLLLILHPLR